MRRQAVGTGLLQLPWEKWAVLLWGIALVVVSTRVLLLPGARSVYPEYEEAGRHWRAGQDLYLGIGGYRYPPPITLLFVGFSYLPSGAAEALWRLLGTGLFLGGLLWWGRAGLPRPLSWREQGLLVLLAAPLSLSSLNNGQANLALAGLLVLAMAGAARQRWNLVTLVLVAACLLKAYPLAIALLLVVLYPRPLGWRLAVGLAVGLALPLLFQEPDYVFRQYRSWLADLRSDDRSNWSLEMGYRDLWLLCRLWHLPVSLLAYRFVQLGTAGLTALLCLAGQWAGWPARRLLPFLFGLGSCWMMLCGPATESSTYALLAPALAWAVFDAWMERRPWWVRAGASASFALVTGAFVAGWFPDSARVHALGPHPLGALLLYVTLAIRLLTELRRPELGGVETAAPTARAA